MAQGGGKAARARHPDVVEDRFDRPFFVDNGSDGIRGRSLHPISMVQMRTFRTLRQMPRTSANGPIPPFSS